MRYEHKGALAVHCRRKHAMSSSKIKEKEQEKIKEKEVECVVIEDEDQKVEEVKDKGKVAPEKSQSGKFYCEKCDKNFCKMSGLRAHMDYLHSKEYLSREEKDADNFRCPYCPERQMSEQSIRKHYELQHPELKNLKRKGDEDPNADIQYVEDQIKSDIFQCAFCPQRYRTERSLHIHIGMKHHGRTPYLGDIHTKYTYKLQIGVEVIEDQNKYVMVKRGLGKLVEGKNTKEDSAKEISLEGFSCKLCHKDFSKMCALRSHITHKHPEQEEELMGKIAEQADWEFQCQKCSKKYQTSKALNHHCRTQHPEVQDKVKEIEKDVLVKDKAAKDEVQDDKKKVVNKEQTMKTPDIKDKETKTEELKKENSVELTCKICKRGFSNKRALRSHVSGKHPNEKNKILAEIVEDDKPVKKDQVQENETETDMKENVTQKTSEMKDPKKDMVKEVNKTIFCCGKCPIKYRNKQALLAHIKFKHHRDQERLLAQITKEDEKNKVKENEVKDNKPEKVTEETQKTEEKDKSQDAKSAEFNCQICGKNFSKMCGFRAHIDHKHPDKKEKLLAKILKSKAENILANSKRLNTGKVHCERCPRSFSMMCALRSHIIHRHPKQRKELLAKIRKGRKPYVKKGLIKKSENICPKCTLKFESEKGLHGHYERNHPELLPKTQEVKNSESKEEQNKISNYQSKERPHRFNSEKSLRFLSGQKHQEISEEMNEKKTAEIEKEKMKGDIPCEAEGCSYRFKSLMAVGAHVRQRHPEIIAKKKEKRRLKELENKKSDSAKDKHKRNLDPVNFAIGAAGR